MTSGSPHAARTMRRRHSNPDAVLVGAAAGVFGAVAMNAFQWLWAVAIDENKAKRRGRLGQGGPLTKAEESETATERAAGVLARAVLGRDMATATERRLAGAALHAVTGAAAGAVYGAAAAKLTPKVTAWRGVLFGAGVWLLADQVAVPLLRLGRAPTRHRWASQLMNLCAHLVFGVTTDAVRRATLSATA